MRPEVGCTVAYMGQPVIVVPTSPKLSDREVDVMHLDGSVQTIRVASIGAVLYDPRDP